MKSFVRPGRSPGPAGQRTPARKIDDFHVL